MSWVTVLLEIQQIDLTCCIGHDVKYADPDNDHGLRQCRRTCPMASSGSASCSARVTHALQGVIRTRAAQNILLI